MRGSLFRTPTPVARHLVRCSDKTQSTGPGGPRIVEKGEVVSCACEAFTEEPQIPLRDALSRRSGGGHVS